jgi:hypothetical protein
VEDKREIREKTFCAQQTRKNPFLNTWETEFEMNKLLIISLPQSAAVVVVVGWKLENR